MLPYFFHNCKFFSQVVHRLFTIHKGFFENLLHIHAYTSHSADFMKENLLFHQFEDAFAPLFTETAAFSAKFD